MSKRDELAEKHYKESGWVPTEWAVMNFHAGYDAAMSSIKDLIKEIEVINREMTDCGRCMLIYDKLAAYKKD